MKIACLCPSYGRPRLLQNALACFQAQTYPEHLRRLFILDDAGQIGESVSWGTVHVRAYRPSYNGPSLTVWSTQVRFPTLPTIYAFLVDRALDWGADAFCVWDDDDIYLPNHLTDHAEVLKLTGWSHPNTVYSLYTGSIVEEGAIGRFHGALAFTEKAGECVDYWGDPTNVRCIHDQEILGRLRRLSPPGRSKHKPTYVYRWGSTQCSHASARPGPDDGTWYKTTPIDQPGHWDTLEPLMDEETIRTYQALSGTEVVR